MLNRIVVDSEHGTIDSPLNIQQVELISGVPEALRKLNDLGFDLSIVTNQPSAAKGKTTRKNLEEVHHRVLELAQAKGGQIFSSEICFHRSEDGCLCRKPGTLLLEAAVGAYSALTGLGAHWMVGDGVTDIQAGRKLGLKTAFLGPQKCDACKVFDGLDLKPTFWGKDLFRFSEFLQEKTQKKNQGDDFHVGIGGRF